jgi:hypothetical protein
LLPRNIRRLGVGSDTREVAVHALLTSGETAKKLTLLTVSLGTLEGLSNALLLRPSEGLTTLENSLLLGVGESASSLANLTKLRRTCKLLSDLVLSRLRCRRSSPEQRLLLGSGETAEGLAKLPHLGTRANLAT